MGERDVKFRVVCELDNLYTSVSGRDILYSAMCEKDGVYRAMG